jgi:hypothetical protein
VPLSSSKLRTFSLPSPITLAWTITPHEHLRTSIDRGVSSIAPSISLSPSESSPAPALRLHTPNMQSSDDAMVSPTPSPPAQTPTQGSAPRRPPRKSTLTQQQRNQKRQRATQDQLVTLEVEFNRNPTPTAATRERIASEINMTERSVQIWFQNR